jgi:predicted nucleic acid-binding protein
VTLPRFTLTWRRIVEACGVSGRQAHDARLAAVMLAHGVSHILTFNVEDFRRYPGIVVVSPQHV